MKKIIETIIIISAASIVFAACSISKQEKPKEKTTIEKTKRLGCKINPWCKNKP